MGTKEEFISLLGKDRVEYLNDNNWIKFERRNFEICQVNEIVIKFLEKDGKGDNVIYFSISYNEDTKEWCAENCIEDKAFSKYEDMLSYVKSIEDKIIDNGSIIPDLI